ncbi:hypothetical protein OHU34_41955 [Streptomyces sp. NBC_00080]
MTHLPELHGEHLWLREMRAKWIPQAGAVERHILDGDALLPA